MSLRARIFLIFAACVAGGFGWLVYWANSDLKTRYNESFEEVLVDASAMLAEQLAQEWPRPPEERFVSLAAAMQQLGRRALSADINRSLKVSSDLRIYITDASGRLLYHSDPSHLVGEDFSRWIDVGRTLKGRYGARTSDELVRDAAGQAKPASVAYVAAPIYVGSELVGVVSLGKPKTNIARFLDRARQQLSYVVATTALGAIALALLLYWWITKPLQELAEYAHGVSRGEAAALPELGDNEVGRVGEAMEGMRRALEDKEYVETYVQALTHEIKSPVTAIRASAELLAGDLPSGKRVQFAGSIEREATRLNEIAERLLQLAALERTKQLEQPQVVALFALAEEVAAAARNAGAARGLQVSSQFPEDGTVSGDPLLLRQAIDNLVRNAAEFSPDGGTIRISGFANRNYVQITVEDGGPGIPDYALERIFDRFYSLPRPVSGRKSTGLGLNFVREVAHLHGGNIKLDCPGVGTRARLTIARQPLHR